MTDYFRVVRLSAFAGIKGWGIEDLRFNGDNVLRDWTRKGDKRRIWRAGKQEAERVCAELNAHPDIIGADAKRAAYGGKTGAILSKQRAQRNSPTVARVVPSFRRCGVCGAMYKGDVHCG